MTKLKQLGVGWTAGGNLVALFALLTVSVGSTIWLLDRGGAPPGPLQRFLVGVELLGFVLGGATAYELYSHVLSPLDSLTDDAEAVAEGDLDRSIDVPDRNDEIALLARSVRKMRDQLLDSVEEARTFERAIEEAGHSVVITDADQTIQYVNPAFEHTTGYTREEALGETPRILQSGDTDPAVYEELWDTLEAGETWDGEFINQRKTGERLLVHSTIAPIGNESGDVDYYVAINLDVTEARLREQVLEVYNRVLRHNLRNRVNVVKGNAELVRDADASRIEAIANDGLGSPDGAGDGPAELPESEDLVPLLENLAADIRDHATTVVEAGERLEELNEKATKADYITEFSTGEERHRPLSKHLAAERERIASTYPAVDVSLRTPSGPTIECKESMRTAIAELLDNAVEHNDAATPWVDIAMDVTDENVVVTVADDGPGIPADERSVLREGKETPLVHGSGLCLWLVYWVVTMNGGRLEIEDREPRGTVVRLVLPRPRVNPTPSSDDAEAAAHTD